MSKKQGLKQVSHNSVILSHRILKVLPSLRNSSHWICSFRKQYPTPTTSGREQVSCLIARAGGAARVAGLTLTVTAMFIFFILFSCGAYQPTWDEAGTLSNI